VIDSNNARRKPEIKTKSACFLERLCAYCAENTLHFCYKKTNILIL